MSSENKDMKDKSVGDPFEITLDLDFDSMKESDPEEDEDFFIIEFDDFDEVEEKPVQSKSEEKPASQKTEESDQTTVAEEDEISDEDLVLNLELESDDDEKLPSNGTEFTESKPAAEKKTVKEEKKPISMDISTPKRTVGLKEPEAPKRPSVLKTLTDPIKKTAEKMQAKPEKSVAVKEAEVQAKPEKSVAVKEAEVQAEPEKAEAVKEPEVQAEPEKAEAAKVAAAPENTVEPKPEEVKVEKAEDTKSEAVKAEKTESEKPVTVEETKPAAPESKKVEAAKPAATEPKKAEEPKPAVKEPKKPEKQKKSTQVNKAGILAGCLLLAAIILVGVSVIGVNLKKKASQGDTSTAQKSESVTETNGTEEENVQSSEETVVESSSASIAASSEEETETESESADAELKAAIIAIQAQMADVDYRLANEHMGRYKIQAGAYAYASDSDLQYITIPADESKDYERDYYFADGNLICMELKNETKAVRVYVQEQELFYVEGPGMEIVTDELFQELLSEAMNGDEVGRSIIARY